ncbi:MAG: protein TonB [Akkermansiaceae bacterium]|jgi:protein TonB
MNPRHVYRPPRRNRFLSTAIIFGGGAMLTFMVFYFIPLMQKLEQGLPQEQPDLAPPIAAEQEEEYVEPEVEQPEDKPEPEPVLVESNDDIAIEPMELPSLAAGTGGRVLLNVTPSVALGGGGNVDTGGVDSEPVVSSKVTPSVSDAARKILSKRGAVRVIVAGMVDDRGVVVETSIAKSSGIAALDQAAMNAFKLYKFKPAIRNGRKAKARIKIPFDFRVR